MKYVLTLLFFLFTVKLSSAQYGWGYVNYTSYKTHGGNGNTSQYGAFANNAEDFVRMFDTSNSNTTITHTGVVPISYLYNGSLQTPRWGNDYFGYKFDFWFVPQQTGLYYFGINSDDASDLLVDGNVLVSYYGGHGANGYQVVGMNMVAGRRYKMVYRGQEYGGGEAFYFMWYRPVGGWGYWNNEITNVDIVPTKQSKMNFDFGLTLDKTKFLIGSTLTSNGWVDVTNLLDSNKISDGNKGTIVGGQVEWSYITISGNITYLNVDLRTFGNISPSSVSGFKILNVYDGPVVYQNSNVYWATYTISKPLSITQGENIRDMGNGSYAFACDITYGENFKYKEQKVTMTTTNNITTLYENILTVSDVYLAFREFNNKGIFGNQTGNEFIYGIQYKNADVNDDGVFNESDCFSLLQHLTGKKNIVDVFDLNKTLKLIPKSNYDSITKSNWNTSPLYLGNVLSFNINTGNTIDTLYYSGTWKGDVNLSHSAIPSINGMSTNLLNFDISSKKMLSIDSDDKDVRVDIIMEKVGDDVITSIDVNPNGNEIGATQFEIYFDNSILEYLSTQFTTTSSINFSRKNDSYISVGSLNTSGGFITNIGYKINFKPKTTISNLLGLISVKCVETLDTSLKNIKVRVL